MNDELARRATSFSSVAEAYERARPEYPAEAARWLTGEPPLDVVDLAAGTGKLTRVLTALGHRVRAVEPLAEMRERLESAVPGTRALEGAAEAIPLPDGSADVVVAAQAFHWFDQPVALREIARVLRPGGMLGLIWNIRDESVRWVARLSEIIGAEPLDRGETTTAVDGSELYGRVESREWRWRQPLGRDQLRELVLSRSYCASRPESERTPILEAVERLHDEAAGPDGLSMPYVTHGFRAARR